MADSWEAILELLEDLEDVEETSQLCETKQEYVPWEQAKSELRSANIDI